MVPAPSLADSDTAGCTHVRKPSGKSYSLHDQWVSPSPVEAGGRTRQRKQMLVERALLQHSQCSVGPDVLGSADVVLLGRSHRAVGAMLFGLGGRDVGTFWRSAFLSRRPTLGGATGTIGWQARPRFWVRWWLPTLEIGTVEVTHWEAFTVEIWCCTPASW